MNEPDPYVVVKATEEVCYESGSPMGVYVTIFNDGIVLQTDLGSLAFGIIRWEDILPFVPRYYINVEKHNESDKRAYKKTDANIDRFVEELLTGVE